MPATAGDIADYLASIYWAQSAYTDKLVLKEKLGHTDLFCHRIKAAILACYVYLMEEYLSQADYANNSFFTTDEAEEIMYKINKICDTNYYLDL